MLGFMREARRSKMWPLSLETSLWEETAMPTVGTSTLL